MILMHETSALVGIFYSGQRCPKPFIVQAYRPLNLLDNMLIIESGRLDDGLHHTFITSSDVGPGHNL